MPLSGASSNFGVTRRVEVDGPTTVTVNDVVADSTAIDQRTSSAVGIITPANVQSTTTLEIHGSYQPNTGYVAITKADDDSAALTLTVAADRCVPFPTHRTFVWPYLKLKRANGSADWQGTVVQKG